MRRQVYEREALVVLQQHVVARTVSLDQVLLEQQRLDFRGCDRDLDALDLRRASTWVLSPTRAAAEIARHPVLQVPRLADIENRVVAPEHAVHARLRWQRGQEGAQVEWRSHVDARVESYWQPAPDRRSPSRPLARRPPDDLAGTSRSSVDGSGCCSGCNGRNRRERDHPAARCSRAVAERAAPTPSSPTGPATPRRGRLRRAPGSPCPGRAPASSAARNSLQVAISAGVGLFCGGTHLTAFVMRQPSSRSPSSAERDTGALAQPYRCSVS